MRLERTWSKWGSSPSGIPKISLLQWNKAGGLLHSTLGRVTRLPELRGGQYREHRFHPSQPVGTNPSSHDSGQWRGCRSVRFDRNQGRFRQSDGLFNMRPFSTRSRFLRDSLRVVVRLDRRGKMTKSDLTATSLPRALAAGLLGITVNTVVLEVAPLLHINAGKGGLLQLFRREVQHWIPSLLPLLSRVGLKHPPTLAGFFVVSLRHRACDDHGLLLCLCASSQRLRVVKSSAFSLVPWLVNAALVFPALGQGFAGARSTPWPGLIYFLFANWLFVVVSALAYRFMSDRPPKTF